MNPKIAKRVGIAGGVIVAVVAAAMIYASRTDTPDDIDTGAVASQIPAMFTQGGVVGLIATLPPTALGSPYPDQAAQPPLPPAKSPDAADLQFRMSGKTAQGRVSRVYVRAAEGVLIDLATAPPSQRDGWRYVELEFPDPLADGETLARALVPEDSAAVEVGDVVEMRFAHKAVKGPYVKDIFPVKEKDKVTALVSKAGTTLAQDYLRRIVARNAAAAAAGPVDVALWKKLPFDRAIKIVHGNGKRNLAVFTDPYCPACQAFEKTAQQVDDVTLYVFMLPVIRPDRMNQSKSVWCSPDRSKAWVDLALNRKVPEAAPDCDNPVESLLALIGPMGIRVTPTLIFENGQRGQGNMLASVLRERLARAETGSQQASAKKSPPVANH